MIQDFFTLLSEQGPIAAITITGLYIIWRRYDKFTMRTQQKLDEAETRIREIMENGHSKLILIAENQQRIISDNTEAMKSIQQMMQAVMYELKLTKKEIIA